MGVKNTDSHPQLHLMLQQTVAIDSVDDESKAEVRPKVEMLS
jgi:hypothetical protein